MNVLQQYTNEFESGRDVGLDEAERLFNALITSSDATRISELLSAWNDKGWTEDELFAFASIMRGRMKRIHSRHTDFVDVVGTGGSRAKTFNVSTAAAFVIAGSGVAVAKHGNRAATSKSGSADVLVNLGINVDIETEVAERCINEIGIGFMFAPRFHALSPTLAQARKMVGRPTIFNNLGPLCNPASAPHQLIGVWAAELLGKTANVLARLGTRHSWIVHSDSGLDEIALGGKTFVAEIRENGVSRFEISAADFGLSVSDEPRLSSCSPEESAGLIKQILGGQRIGDDCEKLVLINAAAAIYLSGRADDLKTAYNIAEESVRSGAARDKYLRLAEATN